MTGPIDVLVVAIDSTGGWIAAAGDLLSSLRRAGASAELVVTGPVPKVRTFALTDYTQAVMARRAAARGIARHQPKAIIYCSITAALLWPRPGAIFLDSMAAENRPGRHGIWQRGVERRRLVQAPLLLPWSRRSLDPARGRHAPAVTLPPPIAPAGDRVPPSSERDIAAVTYAGDPVKRRLDLVLAAWERARRGDEELVVTGLRDFSPPPGVSSAGRIARPEFRRLLQRSRVFLAAPRREDHGIAPLEALACGCQLVSLPAPGPYPALDIGRAIDPRLIGPDLVAGLRTALDEPLADYASRATAWLAEFSPAEVERTVAEEVLPRLLSASRTAPIRP